ncbi:hypothetical protein L207DRAFT_528409 [Hyaloscypha variabilis F]|uniref:Endonuclease/exonuclease/phosphatase domain-containing protein n=1 Tax=Hyaloscypha variabilis (strain UAMH 11265 / GT02V1 / F) TaxID=1149755 RepID=A0A2J6RTH2_HYAVF|nr:hypothetical protein L207DRAFT_528409 [Hyaloscypha variabilis F]
MSSSISHRSMLRAKLPGTGNCKPAHFLVRRLSTPNHHTRYSITNRRFNHATADLPLPENSPAPRILNPYLYCSRTRGWRPYMPAPRRRLEQGSLLRVVSWNIDSTGVGRATRASLAIDHLEEVFGDPSSSLVVMLQKVHHQSLSAILEHPWIRKNFALSNARAPRRYFTLMMVSQHVQTDRWFRIPFQPPTGRDLLAVDIPLSSPDGESEHPKRVLRLCTTHLDLFREAEGEEPRPRQLAQVSALLKAPPTRCSEIIAGLVGGDLNQDSILYSLSHFVGHVDLCDVWDDTTHPPTPIFERLKGNTRENRTPSVRSARRIDSFLYTGMMDAVPLSEVRNVTGRTGRLGIGLKTTIKTWEYHVERRLNLARRGLVLTLPGKSHSDICREGGVRKELNVRVSRHVGSAIGIRVR